MEKGFQVKGDDLQWHSVPGSLAPKVSVRPLIEVFASGEYNTIAAQILLNPMGLPLSKINNHHFQTLLPLKPN